METSYLCLSSFRGKISGVRIKKTTGWADTLSQSPGVTWVPVLSLPETWCGTFSSSKTFFSPGCNDSLFVSFSHKLLEATGKSIVNCGEPNPHPSQTSCKLMTNASSRLSLVFWVELNQPCVLWAHVGCAWLHMGCAWLHESYLKN